MVSVRGVPVGWDRGLRGFNGLEEERKAVHRLFLSLHPCYPRNPRFKEVIRFAKGSIAQPIVFLQELPHSIVRQRVDAVAVTSGHVLIVDQRIHDRFLDRLHGRFEDRIKPVVRHGLDSLRWLFGIGRVGVGG